MSESEPVVRLTRAQVREIDRRAIEEYHIPGIVLMENAARGVADVAMQMLGRSSHPTVAVLCGSGNNGGDGFAAARHLHNRGVDVNVATTSTTDLKGDAATNWQIVERMNIARLSASDADVPILDRYFDLLIDALFGTGLTRSIEGALAQTIRSMNESAVPILAIDLPSGLDCDTGQPLGSCVRATRTVTFVAEKAGFANPESKQYTGEITVADIGAPRELIEIVRREWP